MNKVQVRVATIEDMEPLMELRKDFLEKELGAVGGKEMEHFYETTEMYLKESFRNESQTSCIAYIGDRPVGCAMLCYLNVIPTLAHPSGRRGHLMNVYVCKDARRLHIGSNMVEVLIQEGRKKGITEITLDATEDGAKLYEQCGFGYNKEAMVRTLTY